MYAGQTPSNMRPWLTLCCTCCKRKPCLQPGQVQVEAEVIHAAADLAGLAVRRTRLPAKGCGCALPLPNTAAKLLLPSSSEVCGRGKPSVSLRRCCIRCASEAAASLEDPCNIWAQWLAACPEEGADCKAPLLVKAALGVVWGRFQHAASQRLVSRSICIWYIDMQPCATAVSGTALSRAACAES